MTPRVSVVLGVFEGAEVLDETLARPLWWSASGFFSAIGDNRSGPRRTGPVT